MCIHLICICAVSFLLLRSQGSHNEDIVRYNLPSGEQIWKEESAIFRRYCIATTSSFVITSQNKSRVIMRDLKTGASLHEIKLNSWNLSLCADQRVFVSSDNDGSIRLYDIEAGRELRNWKTDVPVPFAVVIGPVVVA